VGATRKPARLDDRQVPQEAGEEMGGEDEGLQLLQYDANSEEDHDGDRAHKEPETYPECCDRRQKRV
jgi:hypothetical protein